MGQPLALEPSVLDQESPERVDDESQQYNQGATSEGLQQYLLPPWSI